MPEVFNNDNKTTPLTFISLAVAKLLWYIVKLNINSNHLQRHSHYCPIAYVEWTACIVHFAPFDVG